MGKGTMTKEAGWMSFWGLLLFIVGSIRLIRVIALQGDFGGDVDAHIFPYGLLLGGAMAEVGYGFITFFVGMMYLIYGKEDPTWTLGALFVQLAGWFTWVVYTLTYPSYEISAFSPADPNYDISVDSWKGLAINALITGVLYCMAIHSVAFFATLDFYSQQSKNTNMLSARGVAGYLNILLLASGVTILAHGSRIYELLDVCKEGVCEELLDPIVFPPLVVVWPVVFIVSGCVQTLVGLFGFIRLFAVDPHSDEKGGCSSFTGACLLVWLMLILMNGIPAFGWVFGTAKVWPEYFPMITALCIGPFVYDAKFLTGKDYNVKDFL